MKMSDKEYMNAAQLYFFRQKLLTLKDDILKNPSETTASRT
jgi:DnaK suppressor protein